MREGRDRLRASTEGIKDAVTALATRRTRELEDDVRRLGEQLDRGYTSALST